MAVRTWTGAVSNLWNVAGNWDTLPSAGDDLVFPLTPTGNKSNSNNFTADTSFNSITIQGTGYTLAGNRITLGAGGITQTTGTNTISLAIVLGADVTVDMEGTQLTLSGIISESGGARSLSKTGVTGLIYLRAANTFTGGCIVKEGVAASSDAAGFGAGTISIGNSSGSVDAGIRAVFFGTTATNPITVVSGSSGVLSIEITGAVTSTFSGQITLGNDLTVRTTAVSAVLILSGGITGTGNVTIGNSSTGTTTLSGSTVNHVGTITNSGTGTGTTTISAVIGTNVTGVIQNSATSQLTLSGANTFTGGLTIKAGTCLASIYAAALGSGTVYLGDSSGSESAMLALQINVSNPLSVVSGSSGTATLQANNGRNYTGAITLARDLNITATQTGTFTLTGGVTGTGNLTLSTSAGIAITISTTTVNHTGTITNSGTGTGATTISAVIGTNVTGVIQNSATSKLVISGAGTIANCSDKLAITSGQLQLSTVNTVANLFVDATGCTDKTAQLILAATQTVTTELKLRGSVANRLLVTSDILGTTRRIGVYLATISNCQSVDFRDVDFNNGGSNVDLSAITGGSGDCGGNTITGGGVLSFTTADDWYWYSASGGTYNLSDRTYWFTATNGGGTQMGADRGPLPQDMLYVDGSSINGATTIDQDMPRMPGIDWTGCDAVTLHLNNVLQSVFGSFIGSGNLTCPAGNTITMESRGASLLSASVTSNVQISSKGGSVTLSGDLNTTSGYSVFLTFGTLDADIYNVTCGQAAVSGTASGATWLMGSGTWTVNFLTVSSVAGLTSTSVGETSTIIFGSATVSTTRTFAGGGLTYNNLSIVANTTGTQQITITGSNTFNTLTINGPKTINFTAGTTQTVSSFATTGTGIVLKSTTPGSPWYLVDASGTNQVSNCTISDSYPRGSDAGGGALWLASDGTNTDAGGNVAYDGATNRGWKWTGFAPWLMRRRRRMAGAR